MNDKQMKKISNNEEVTQRLTCFYKGCISAELLELLELRALSMLPTHAAIVSCLALAWEAETSIFIIYLS